MAGRATGRMMKFIVSIIILSIGLWAQLIVGADALTGKNFMAQVEQRLGRIKSVQAQFEQRRTLKLLNHAAIFHGEIFIQEPGKLAWHVYTPIRYSCIISGDTMTQWDADSNDTVTISAKQVDALRLLFRQLRYWFSGQFAALSQEFDSTINVKARQLKFSPKLGTPPQRFIKSITITLRDDLAYIQQIVINEKNGDTMTMIFTQTIINQPLPANAWKINRKK